MGAMSFLKELRHLLQDDRTDVREAVQRTLLEMDVLDEESSPDLEDGSKDVEQSPRPQEVAQTLLETGAPALGRRWGKRSQPSLKVESASEQSRPVDGQS